MPTTGQRRVIDPILSSIVLGYRHPEHIGFALFPRVPVMVSGGKVIEFDKNSFRLYNTSRAPGTPFKRMQFGYQGNPFALENHGLEAPVPREHQREAGVVPGIDLASRAVNGVMRVNSLVLEKNQADLARDDTKYDANHKLTLSGTDQWSDPASDPIGDINDAKEAIRSSTGVYPNVMEISASVFKVLKEHAKIIEKIKYSERGVVTVEILAAVFDIPKIVIGKAIAFDDNDNSIDIWGKDVVLAYVPDNPEGMEEPSYGYTYTMEGHPNVEVPYWEDSSKSWIYGVGYERAPVLTGIVSGFVIKNAIA